MQRRPEGLATTVQLCPQQRTMATTGCGAVIYVRRSMFDPPILPKLCPRLTLERAYDVGRDPPSVESSRLRSHDFATHRA